MQSVTVDIVKACHGNLTVNITTVTANVTVSNLTIYTYDISPYLVGYIVGKQEWLAKSVINTNQLHTSFMPAANTYFRAIYTPTPFEIWLAGKIIFWEDF